MNFDPDGASQYLLQKHGLRRTSRTLANLRSQGGGPRFHRASSREIIYRADDLDKWAADLIGQAVSSTAEYREPIQHTLPLEDAK